MFFTSIRLPEEIHDRLELLAKKQVAQKSYYIHEAIYTHLAELEKRYFTESELVESIRSTAQKNPDVDW